MLTRELLYARAPRALLYVRAQVMLGVRQRLRLAMSQRLRHVMRHVSRSALLLLAVGCSGGRWEPRRIELPFPMEPSDVVWIWSSGGKFEKWHAVVITAGSVSGIPYRMALQCDSCRRSMPRAQVDSMKLGRQTRAPKALEIAGVVVAGLLLEILICYAAGAKSGC